MVVLRSGVLLVAIISALCAVSALAQADFVYTNNDPSGPNSVSGFAVAPAGTLTPITGSPFLTGGTGSGGGLFAVNRITASIVGNFLYIANTGSHDISAFSIDGTTGVLTSVPGSPFGAGSGGSSGEISVAVTPNSRFLVVAATASSDIAVFRITATGALTPVMGSPFAMPSPPDGIKVSADGRFLAVASPHPSQVAMFRIGPDGALTPVADSPFAAAGPGEEDGVTGLDINCAGTLLFGGVSGPGSTFVDVFSMAANGVLAPVAGSPFIPGVGVNSNVAVLSPNGQLLFVSNQLSDTVTVFAVAPDGGLTLVPGSPFPNGGGFSSPAEMATNRVGTLLYTANFSGSVSVFSVGSSGALTPVAGSPFSTGQGQGLLSLAAFPATACVGRAGVPAIDRSALTAAALVLLAMGLWLISQRSAQR